MPLELFNTLSGQCETFIPLNEQRVTMYVCGPTVYNYIHIGNARPIIVFDVLYRLLKQIYPNVVYARNITDIDDKIINSAKDSGQTIQEITQKFTAAFHNDIATLNTLPPSIEPYASQHIPQMIVMIKKLIKHQFAYIADNHVLFHTPSMPQYGRLSNRKLEDMIAGARVEVAPYKKNPCDFVLWKPSQADQPGWDSPWGFGRPGWHLECSIMADVHLGKMIDIHGGGQDLIFPHHENEIAQSCCAYQQDIFAKYWVHNGYITINKEKMSKSRGNFFTLCDVLKDWHGEVVRYALLSTHYKKPLDWGEQTLIQAKDNLDKLYQRLLDSGYTQNTKHLNQVDDNLMAALASDLNTPQAMRELHRLAQSGKIEQMIASANMLGLLQSTPDDWFKWQSTNTATTPLDNQTIETLINERDEARLAKDYTHADAIRDELNKAGIILEDKSGKTRWRRN